MSTANRVNAIRCHLVGGMIFLSLCVVGVSGEVAAKELCNKAFGAEMTAGLNSTVRGFTERETYRFRLEVEEPGIVTVEGKGLASAGLASFSTCNQGRMAVIEESESHLSFVALSPGTYYFGLESDLSDGVQEFELLTHFVSTELREDVLSLGPVRALRTEIYFAPSTPKSSPVVTVLTLPEILMTKEEYHEVDPDPYAKGFEAEGTTQVVLVHRENLTKEEYHEVDPDPYAKEVRSEGRDLMLHALVVATLQPGEYLVRVSGPSSLR